MEQRENHVPYIVHEASMARMERIIKRLWIVVVILIVALVGTNLAWTLYESQFETIVTETYTSESDDGGIAIVNRDGEVNYGESYLHAYEEASAED